MQQPMTLKERSRLLAAGGLGETASRDWARTLADFKLPPPGQGNSLRGGGLKSDGLEADAARARPIFATGWELLGRLPLRSQRSAAEKRAGASIVTDMADLCWRFCRAHRRALYDRLTANLTRAVRVDHLAWQAAELWPGLLPSRREVEQESTRMQKDKDGREINQGMFIGQMLSDRETGTHLVLSNLRPLEEALERSREFQKKGVIKLKTVRVEARGETGYLYFSQPKYLNAEDNETIDDQELGTDLVLLHPGLRIGVLRGDPVQHPKYKGRRIFSAGLNLTKLYHGKLPFLFYLRHDLGWLNKIYRGLTGPDEVPGEPETTLEKPWIAVVDGFAIGGGCQLLLVVDYVIAESGAFFNLPARKEGIIPGCANLRLPRFMGERMARQAIMFDKTFYVDSPEAATLINEVHPREALDEAVERACANALDSGMVSASGNRKAIRVETEPLDRFREYMATNAREQAFCHLSEQLSLNLEKHWKAKERKL